MEQPEHRAGDRPLLVYDGDCGFCRYCVDYARAATGEAVAYAPFQSLAPGFHGISREDYAQAIRLVEPGGAVCAGAGAAFRALELGGCAGLWARLYRAVPAFAAASEWCYRRVAVHRPAAHRLCRALFGRELRPARVTLTAWLFLRLLALVYLAAFASFTLQAAGLVGDDGILPASAFLRAVDAAYGPQKYALLPTLLWLHASTGSILALGVTGCLASLLLLADRGTRAVLPVLYLLYLSLYHGGQIFLSYQWDIFLLECGFLAIFLPWSPRLVTWLYRWLLLRFMLQSGLVKLMSGDPAWRNFSALDYHFQTQPLPDVLAWYADRLPQALLHAGVAYTLFVELIVPFLMLLPRRPRQLAALAVVPFQLAITATGSYNFFNLLTASLCLLLLDDQCLARLLPRRLAARAGRARPAPRATRLLVWPVAALYLVVSVTLLAATGRRELPGGLAGELVRWTSPWQVASGYGLFAVMTTERPEIVFEGSRDGRNWLPYELPYKPGDPARAPGWATPGQPRLDWQLWFAALESPAQNRWIDGVVAGLLRGSPAVLGLFANDPFPDAPPRYVRALLYRYRFTTPAERRATGNWWHRDYLGVYWPVTGWRLPLERAGGS